MQNPITPTPSPVTASWATRKSTAPLRSFVARSRLSDIMIFAASSGSDVWAPR